MLDVSDRCVLRRERLRALIHTELASDVLLVTHLPNVRYLTGFSGSNAVLVIGADADDDLIGTDGRYADQVAAESPGLPVVLDRDTLLAILARMSRRRVAVESGMTVGDVRRVEGLHGEPTVADRLVEGLRATKDPSELAALERACSITATAFDLLREEIRPGSTEISLARRLEQVFGELGAEDRAFDTIVGGGPHSAIPHHQPGDRPLEPGDLLVIDAGARVEGYHADMTRTFVVGRPPAPWQSEIHGAVQAAQAAATAGYLDGADARGIDEIARGVVAQAGLADRFTHGLGHGVGLEIHEAPNIGMRSTGTIGSDMAITVEPGVYLPGRGGVRIEDTLVVTDTGPRILTEGPRDLLTVG
jgi:Xaa-Pro aminopeptidase